MEWVMESDRLNYRKIKNDFVNLKPILQNIEIMYAWGHAFTDSEIHKWIDENLVRYENEGFSYFAVIEKITNQFVGVAGPLIECINDIKYIGIAYIIDKNHWGKGYGLESAKVSMDYAFSNLNAKEVIAQIRSNNLFSRKIAEKLNMKIRFEYVKHYNNEDMTHLIYCITKYEYNLLCK